MATCFSDEVFTEVSYKAKNPKHIISGIDEFLDSVTVIPPGEWDPSIRIEPPVQVASQDGRKHPKKPDENVDDDELRQKSREESGLVLSGRIFGGLIKFLSKYNSLLLQIGKTLLFLLHTLKIQTVLMKVSTL